MKGRALQRQVPSLVLFAVLLVIWQALPPALGIREYLLPGPVAVVRAALSFSIPWHTHLWVTTLEILGGFVLAGVAGVALGVAIAWSPTIARALVPFLVFVNTLPSYQGWHDVMENPKAALEIFKKRVPDIDLALIEPNMMLGLDLMKTDRYAKNGIGWVERAKMCHTVELINTYMPDMPRKVGCDEVFTNELLTKIEPPKR